MPTRTRATAKENKKENATNKRRKVDSGASVAADNSSVTTFPKPVTPALISDENRAAWQSLWTKHYYLKAPTELVDVFALAKQLKPEKPTDAFVETIGVRLAGPFDLLARSGETVELQKPLYLHGRYFVDTPEVVTILEDTTSDCGAHWGYYRDAPAEEPKFVVFAADAQQCKFDIVAPTLIHFLQAQLDACTKKQKALPVFQAQQLAVSAYIHKHMPHIASVDVVRKQREHETIAASLHGLGIVVPYDEKKRTGFRALPVVDQQLRDILAKAQALDAAARKSIGDLITRATIATDECDFGTGLLLGLDVFTAGKALEKQALQLLRVAYMMLGRKQFKTVVLDHIKHRHDTHRPTHAFQLPDHAHSHESTHADTTAPSSLALPSW